MFKFMVLLFILLKYSSSSELPLENPHHNDETIIKYVKLDDTSSGDDPKVSISKFACIILNMVLNKVQESKIREYIEKNVPENWRNKVMMALNSGGIMGLKWILRSLCIAPTNYDTTYILELSDRLMPIISKVCDVMKEKFFIFIDWLILASNSGDDYLSDAAKSLLKNLENINENQLEEAIEYLKPYGKELGEIFTDIQEELSQIIESQ